MRRGDIFPDDGPEWEKPIDDRLERLTQHELKTRLIEAQVDLLLGVIEAYREGWKQ
jgi:hypothetical protein